MSEPSRGFAACHQSYQVPRRRSEITHRRIPVDHHQQIGLGEQAPQDVDDSIGAIKGQASGIGTADTYGRGAQGECLQDVGTSTDA